MLGLCLTEKLFFSCWNSPLLCLKLLSHVIGYLIIVVTRCFNISSMTWSKLFIWNCLVISHSYWIDRLKSWSILDSSPITKIMSLLLDLLIATKTFNIRPSLLWSSQDTDRGRHLRLSPLLTHVVVNTPLIKHGHLKFLLLLEEFQIIFEVILGWFSISCIVCTCLLPVWWILLAEWLALSSSILTESILVSLVAYMLSGSWVFKLWQILSLLSDLVINVLDPRVGNIINTLTIILLIIRDISITLVCVY